MPRVRVGRAGEVPPGEGRVVAAGPLSLGLFNLGGRYYAVDNACPHRGGPLGEGTLQGTTVSCPWHGRRWDVASGASASNPGVRVACFPVEVAGDEVFVTVP